MFIKKLKKKYFCYFATIKMYNNPSKTCMMISLEDSKQLLQDYICSNDINIPEGFDSFFEKFASRVKREIEFNNQASIDEELIRDIIKSTHEFVDSEASKIILDNCPIFIALDFLNDFSSNKNMLEPKLFLQRFQELAIYLNTTENILKPYNLNPNKLQQSIPKHFEVLKENLQYVIQGRELLTLKEEVAAMNIFWEKKFEELNRNLNESMQLSQQNFYETAKKLQEKLKIQEKTIENLNGKLEAITIEHEKKISSLENICTNDIGQKVAQYNLFEKKVDNFMNKINEDECRKVTTILKKMNLLNLDEICFDPVRILKDKIPVSKAVNAIERSSVISKIRKFEMTIEFDQFFDLQLQESQLHEICELISKSKLTTDPYDEKIFKVQSKNSDSIANSTFKMLEKFRSLTELALDFRHGKNQVNDESIKILSGALENNQSLFHITLFFGEGNNQITDKGLLTIMRPIQKMTMLSYFEISLCEGKNFITDGGMEALAEALKELRSINILKLYFNGGRNNVGTKGIKAVANSLLNLTAINYLDFGFDEGNNNVADDGLMHIANSFKVMKAINTLKLYFMGGKNQITDRGIEILAINLKEIKLISNLQLMFSYGLNGITDKGLDNLCGALKNMKAINNLTLGFCYGNNKITDKGMDSLKYALQDMKSISHLELYLSNNTIGDGSLNSLLMTFKNMTLLNTFTGYFKKTRMTENVDKFVQKFKKENPGITINFFR